MSFLPDKENNRSRTVFGKASVQKAKKQARASRANLKTLIISYGVLLSVLTMQFLQFSSWTLGALTILGLVTIGISYWKHGKKIYDLIYKQEIGKLESLALLARQKKVNNKNIVGTIKALAASVEAKDSYTHGHSEKVARHAVEIAKRLGCSRNELETIKTAALLHDIGKIGIADQLLCKRDVLTSNEWEELRRHPERGANILKHIDAIKDCMAIVLHHHERYDGTGYPKGLKGDAIPFGARIIAVADTFDAITSERPYRPNKMTWDEALAELERCSNKQLDSQIVAIMATICRNINHEPTQNHCTVASGTRVLKEVPIVVDC